MSKSKTSINAAPAKSGATGGPSTGHGLGYQIDYAIFRTLELISHGLAVPTKAWAIRMEPRAHDLYGITRWDIGISPPDRLFEAKLNPTKVEIWEWLDNVRDAGQMHHDREFNLVYSKGGGPLLASVRHLVRNAKEANGDQDKFNAIAGHESIKNANEILVRLGDQAFDLLAQSNLLHMPEECLKWQVKNHALLLSGPIAGKRLIEYLFRKFHDGVWTRGTFAVADVIAEIEHAGIRLQAPPEIADADISSQAAAAIYILQACTMPVPAEVIAEAIGESILGLSNHLKKLTGIVQAENDLISIKPLTRRLTCPIGDHVLVTALQSLLWFIKQHKREEQGKGQVDNAVALARKCAGMRPDAVARVFLVLDKLLKARGDKHLVLDVAELSIDAARRAPASREITEGEVQALICGKAWVYQRIGRLAEAHAAAERSLHRGEDIGWTRNTAFCKKCIGRLYRIEAEAIPGIVGRMPVLDASVAKLKEAISEFENCPDPDLGPGCAEIGDCYSLLGRTYLTAGNLKDALSAAREAMKLIVDTASKDYMDLAILIGDLEVAAGRRDAADAWYDEVIASPPCANAERSEIRARAYLARGTNRAVRRQGSASSDFTEAAKIWKSLDESECAAKAEWEKVRLAGTVSENIMQLLERERALVRLAAYREHDTLAAGVKGGRTRSDPSLQYWQRRIREAKEKVGVEEKDW